MPLILTEAQARADLIRQTTIDLELDLTSTEHFGCRAVVSFTCTAPGSATFLELSNASDLLVKRRDADGEWRELDLDYDGERIPLADLAERNEVQISAVLPYVSDGDGMHTMTDPADGERYVCAYTSMDITRKVLPIFDQPDIKASFNVSVVAPAHWSVLANGRFRDKQPAANGVRWTFDPTPPISSYLFSLAAGPWASFTWDVEYNGKTLPFGWHARAALADALERDAEDLKAITESCFRYYAGVSAEQPGVFDEPYPFDDYQQVMGPGLNWGAMEFPGVVIYRDELLPAEPPTRLAAIQRASVIAHEMAHMWFGNLVTMRWWEDSWLNESFADYMGYSVSAAAAGYQDSWVSFSLGRKPTAYRADRRRSTHPIAASAESVPDVDTAFSNFDMITYAKGASVLRQLVTWLGEEDFFAGVNRHMAAHRFGNATLADFLDSLDAATDRDVRSWAERYLLSTGFDTITVSRDAQGVPVLTRNGTRPHRLTVTAFDDTLAPVGSNLIDLVGEPVALPEFAGRVIVPNSADEAYAELVLDQDSWTTIQQRLGAVSDPVTRSLLWSAAVSDAEAGRMPTADLVALASHHLVEETHPAIFESALGAVTRVLRSYGNPEALAEQQAGLATLATAVLATGDPARRQAAARVLAATSIDIESLTEWLDTEADQEIRWHIVTRLAGLNHPEHIEVESGRDASLAGSLATLGARAAIASSEAKATAWQSLMSGELSNREFTATANGFWAWDQQALIEPYLDRYAHDGLELGLRTGQAFGRLIGNAFPVLPLTQEQRMALRAGVDGCLQAGKVPTVLARSWQDSIDDLDRVIRAGR